MLSIIPSLILKAFKGEKMKIYNDGQHVNGPLLRKKIKEKKLTMRKVALIIGCSYNAVSLWCNSASRSIQPIFLERLSELLEIPQEQFIINTPKGKEKFGEKLKKEREKRGFTQKHIANLFNKSIATVSIWEKTPDKRNLKGDIKKYAKLLKIDTE